MKKLILLSFLVLLPMSMNARFGSLGFEKQSTFEDYQKYVGQTVKYIVGINMVYDSRFRTAGGNPEKEYIITKIKGNENRLNITLQVKNGKKKIILIAKEKTNYYYQEQRITDIPLLFVDKMESYKVACLEKFKTSPVGITDIRLQEDDGEKKVVFQIKDKIGNHEYLSNVNDISELDSLGKTYSRQGFKCNYSIVNIYYDYKETIRDFRKHYILRNSLDGSTEDVIAKNAESIVFFKAESGLYLATLKEVEKPANPEVRYGKTTSLTNEDVTQFSYEDNFINFIIYAAEDRFCFTLKNISENSIKVIWNEGSFVDVDGTTSKIMHGTTKFSQRDADQPATTIIKNAKLSEVVVPVDKVYYDETLKIWTANSLFDNARKSEKGQIMQLMLPIQVKDVINEYVFKFELTYKYKHPEYIEIK